MAVLYYGRRAKGTYLSIKFSTIPHVDYILRIYLAV